MNVTGDAKKGPEPRLDSAPMRPAPRSVLLCAALAALALLVGGCGGGDETITEEQAAEVSRALENVADTYENNNCEGTEEALAEAESAIEALDLGGDAAATVEELFARTERLASDCEPADEGPTAPTEPVPTTETFEETTQSTQEETDQTSDTTGEDEGGDEQAEDFQPQPPSQGGGDDDGDDDGTGGAVVPDEADDRRAPGAPGSRGNK